MTEEREQGCPTRRRSMCTQRSTCVQRGEAGGREREGGPVWGRTSWTPSQGRQRQRVVEEERERDGARWETGRGGYERDPKR